MQSGVYNLTVSGSTVPTWCQLYGGAMYMLIMKIDGNKGTFVYSSSYWTSQTGFQSTAYASGLDTTEYQSQLYWQMPFTTILLAMRPYNALSLVNYLPVSYSAATLYNVVAAGSAQPGVGSGLSISRGQWESLATGSQQASYVLFYRCSLVIISYSCDQAAAILRVQRIQRSVHGKLSRLIYTTVHKFTMST